MIGAYFAQHGAPVASVRRAKSASGGTVPITSRCFRRLTDLVSQVSDPDFSYFVWGQNVVIVDGQTNVVSAIVPDVLAPSGLSARPGRSMPGGATRGNPRAARRGVDR
jgi:hypothetical protein